MSSPAQKWSQKRNWHKARIIGMLAVCHNSILTRKERLVFNKILIELRGVLENWDKENSKSKQNYLNI